MRKMKLTVLSLLALGAMSLASCTGAQGEKGDKGDQGEQGIQGEPGEPGEPGEDGSLWYSGEGAPSSDLGKEGDMYLDTSTSDVYQKGSDGWTKIANIKGDDGEDGEDGEDGKNGSNGSNGLTAWSNTILPCENGYITSSVGSAIVGAQVAFTLHPNTSYVPTSLELNGEAVIPTKGSDGLYSYTTTMVEGGFVVKATFGLESDNVSSNSSYFVDGQLYTNGTVDAFGNGEGGTINQSIKFNGGNGTEASPLGISNPDEFLNLQSTAIRTSGFNYEIQSDLNLTSAGANYSIDSFSGSIVGELKEDGTYPTITTNDDYLSDRNIISCALGDVEIKNVNLDIEDGGLIYFGQKSISNDEEIVLENIRVNSSYDDTNFKTSAAGNNGNNESGLIWMTDGIDVTISDVIVNGDYNFTTSPGYNGVIYGGYATDTLNDGYTPTITIKNTTFNGNIIGDQVAYFFGNKTGMGDVKYVLENNTLNGTIYGYTKANVFFANIGDSDSSVTSLGLVNSDSILKITNPDNIKTASSIANYRKVEESEQFELNLIDSTSIDSIEVNYSVYLKGPRGTLLTTYVDTSLTFSDLSQTLIIPMKKFAYKENNSNNPNLIKIDIAGLESSIGIPYISSADEDKATAVSGYAITMVRAIKDGKTVGMIYLN